MYSSNWRIVQLMLTRNCSLSKRWDGEWGPSLNIGFLWSSLPNLCNPPHKLHLYYASHLCVWCRWTWSGDSDSSEKSLMNHLPKWYPRDLGVEKRRPHMVTGLERQVESLDLHILERADKRKLKLWISSILRGGVWLQLRDYEVRSYICVREWCNKRLTWVWSVKYLLGLEATGES